MVIAVDAMGGDFAPEAVIDGALLAAEQGVSLALFGDKARIELLLDQRNNNWRGYQITVVGAPEEIAMDEEPVASIRKKPTSSLVMAVKSVRSGDCQAVLSAGNSGALMAASMLLLGRQKGVSRAAIAGFIPSQKGPVLVLDMGANTECRAEHLAQFAQMGSNYAAKTLGIEKPGVALLANGHEDGKGSQLTKEAFQLISTNSTINFLGNIEPYGIFKGDAHVVVTDGFSGNILLKTMEASLYYFKHQLAESAGATALTVFETKAGVGMQGGASLLGVNGRVTVCHGNADSLSIKQAIMRLSRQIKESKESEGERVVP